MIKLVTNTNINIPTIVSKYAPGNVFNVDLYINPNRGLAMSGTRAWKSPTTLNILPISALSTSFVHCDRIVTVIRELN